MKVLFTGSSSFTGYWFVKGLAEAGHDVVATFQRRADGYSGVRKERVAMVASMCPAVFECSFGSKRFFEVIEEESGWELFCQHAAYTHDYKSPDFDAIAALKNNTHNLPSVLRALKEKGCTRVLLTGSVFEYGEGAGSDDLRAFSPYGLSKGLTAQVFRYHASVMGMRFGKFVIPNPFGPYEEPRFTSYLVRNWYEGKVPEVSAPDYVRDNIHVRLLANAYVHFAENLEDGPGFEKLNPSGYAGSQGGFAVRFAKMMAGRLPVACEIELKEQTEFPEPKARVNTDRMDELFPDWDEGPAWDELADYYKSVFGGSALKGNE